MDKLTNNAQLCALKWIGNGWKARRSHGSAIEVNGQRLCNVDTMMALYRRGLAVLHDDGTWSCTESGKTIAQELAF